MPHPPARSVGVGLLGADGRLIMRWSKAQYTFPSDPRAIMRGPFTLKGLERAGLKRKMAAIVCGIIQAHLESVNCPKHLRQPFRLLV